MNDDESPFLSEEPDTDEDPLFGGANFDSVTQSADGAGMFSDVVNLVCDVDDPVALGGDLLGVGLDALGFVADPLGSLASAGIGWLIEHVGFTKKTLDYLAGDPDAITKRATTWTQIANALDQTAQAYVESAAKLDGNEGGAISRYRSAAHGYAETVKLASAHARTASTHMNQGAMVVGVTRGLVRDEISGYAAKMITRFLTASAMAPVSFGASEALFISDAVLEGTAVAGRNVKKANKAIKELEDLAKKAEKSRDALGKGTTALEKRIRQHANEVVSHNKRMVTQAKDMQSGYVDAAKMAKGKQSVNSMEEMSGKLDDLAQKKPYLAGKAEKLAGDGEKLESLQGAAILDKPFGSATPFAKGVEQAHGLNEKLDNRYVDVTKEAVGQGTYDDHHRQDDANAEVDEQRDKHWHNEGHLW